MEKSSLIENLPVLYTPPPYFFRAEFICVAFEADARKIKPLMPSVFPVYENCLCSLWLVNYLEAAGLGPYYECMFLVGTSYNERGGVTCPSIFVTTDVSLCCGREVWGFPKRLADITLSRNETVAEGMMVHKESGKVSVKITGLKKEKFDFPPPPRVYLLRHIPAPSEEYKPLRQIITVRMKDFTLTEYYAGAAEVLLEGAMSVFKPMNILQSFYGAGTWSLPGGKILKEI